MKAQYKGAWATCVWRRDPFRLDPFFFLSFSSTASHIYFVPLCPNSNWSSKTRGRDWIADWIASQGHLSLEERPSCNRAAAYSAISSKTLFWSNRKSTHVALNSLLPRFANMVLFFVLNFNINIYFHREGKGFVTVRSLRLWLTVHFFGIKSLNRHTSNSFQQTNELKLWFFWWWETIYAKVAV